MKAFFKKTVPKTPIWLRTGQKLTFQTFDGQMGYYQTEVDWVADDLRRCIRENRGGITEITQAEYDGWLKKKQLSSPSKSPWREELRPPVSPDTVSSTPTKDAPPAEDEDVEISITPKSKDTPPQAPKVSRRKV